MSALKPIALALLLGACLVGVLAAPAGAEPETEGDDITAQIKKQMDKIIRLMHENEDALLDLSTGRKARPTRVDIEPAVPPQPAGSEDSDASRADETQKRVRRQQRTGERIPVELEELVRLVPL